MPKKPPGFFRIPPDYAEISEEERLAHAALITDKIRDAIVAQDFGTQRH
jgi:hypothetical protein